MQINKVQGPNFGMALVITPEGKKFLQEKANMKTLEELRKSGERLKDTLFLNLKVDGDGMKIAGRCSNTLETLKEISHKPDSKSIDLLFLNNGAEKKDAIYYVNSAEAQLAYSRLKDSNEVPALTEIIEKLDEKMGNQLLISDYETMKTYERECRLKEEAIENLSRQYGEKK